MEPAQNPRVLLVEDDVVLSTLLSSQFSNQDVQCVVAATGEEALGLLKEDQNFGVILLDISLPGTDGFEVLAAIKKDPKVAPIPVIVVSNFSQEKDIAWGKKLGAAQFVSKVSMVPVEIVTLALETISHPPPVDVPQRMHLMPDIEVPRDGKKA